jgi:hypothetical protein
LGEHFKVLLETTCEMREPDPILVRPFPGTSKNAWLIRNMTHKLAQMGTVIAIKRNQSLEGGFNPGLH